MKMKSITGKDVYVTSQCGMHCIWVSPDWTDVPNHMLRDALMQGCVPEGVEQNNFNLAKAVVENEGSTQSMNAIIKSIENMFSLAQEGDFTSAGMPNLKRLSSYAGFPVSREQMSEALAIVEQKRRIKDLEEKTEQ